MAVGRPDMEVEEVSRGMEVAMAGMEGMRRLVCFFRSLYIVGFSWPDSSFLF